MLKPPLGDYPAGYDIYDRRPAKVQPRYTEALGTVLDPTAYFDTEKQAILQEVGDLSEIRVPLNRILVAVWVRGERREGSGLIIPETVRDEDKWQGVSALVLKMGPHCYEDNDQIAWQDEDRAKIGDWVLFRRGEGFRLRLFKRECVMLGAESAIKMILPRPDAVF
jgi:co-chaperonin GroES (HSP10)